MTIRDIKWAPVLAGLLAATAFAYWQLGTHKAIPAAVPARLASKPLQSVGMLDPVGDQDLVSAAALVKKISQEKASVTEVFRGPAGFTGVVVNAGEGKFIGWMPATRDVLIVGAMFDQNGKNVTQAEMVSRGFAQPAKPSDAGPPPKDAIQAAVEKTSSFTEGTSGPLVTAFVDFNCGYCREFFQRSRAYIGQGTMRVRWVPVAILSDSSLPKAAAVLGNSDPSSAMAMAEDGTLTPVTSVSASLKEKIGANTAVLNLLANGNPGTPTLVMRRADGTFNISPGLPQNLVGFINGTSQ
jgi:thiol:disulfide interchange protein DsbG